MRSVTSLVVFSLLVCLSCDSAKDNRPSFDQQGPPTPGTEAHPGPQPDFGPLVKAQDPPPPISGGTMAVARDGNIVVASDPDRDRVDIVDLAARTVVHSVELAKKSEPGRVAIDGANRAHVALRGSHEVATIDIGTGQVLFIRKACIAPRGIGIVADTDVKVACANGELVTFDVNGGDVKSRVDVGRDARDVIVMRDGSVKVTHFRDAKLFAVDDAGNTSVEPALGGANLAWRAIAAPPTTNPITEGGQESVAVVAQEADPEPVKTDPGGYGSVSQAFGDSCAPTAFGIVTTRLELTRVGQVHLPAAVLPVDLATNGREYAVVAAGNANTKELPQIFVVFASALKNSGECAPIVQGNVPGQAIAAAFSGKDDLVVQTREPAAIHIMTEDRRRPLKTIPLPGESRADTGHAIFHSNAGGFLACASCHAEGGDDGHTWSFVDMGPRRTPSLLGTTKGTQPYHWDGDQADLRHLVDNVFTGRMSGPKVDDPHLDALSGWLFALPAPPRLQTETDAVVRGKDLFDQRCTSCHAGAMLTNNQSVDVGTGGKMQVPSLVGVAWRAPYIHDGCARTLFDRFLPDCGGSAHGDTRDLRQDQIRDLVTFLETL